MIFTYPARMGRAARWCATTASVATILQVFCWPVSTHAEAGASPTVRLSPLRAEASPLGPEPALPAPRLQSEAASSRGPFERAPGSRHDGVRWGGQRFVYKAEGKRLSEVLSDFAASQDVPAVIADGVDGIVQASFDATPDQFLMAVSKAYGIIWYFDGAAIYFYPSRAIQSRIFRLRGYTGAQVDSLLRSLRLADQRYPLRYDKAESTLLVYGPPRHIELASAAIESLDVGAGEGHRTTTRVVPLRYAWAADRHFGEATLPGLATLLNGLYGHESAGTRGARAAGTGGEDRKATALSRAYGLDRGAPQVQPPASGQEPPRGPQDRSMTGNGPRGVRSPIDDDQDTPNFQADEATNAVIVRGRNDRMNEYTDLIHHLDLKPTLVELEAMIIDVNDDSIDSLGIDWSASGVHGSISVTAPANAPVGSNFGTATQGIFTISTLWANAGRQLLASINALEANGKARVIAKPRVLGVANRTAVMRDKRIANIRVAGNLDTSLYQVEAGTDLQVTPQVMSLDSASRIKLSIYIVDGKFESVEVDQVPLVKRTEIQTEAYMTEGESLLIGGITSESEVLRRNSVPGLSKIPIIGGLFRQNEAQTAHSERLFLITPRLLRDAPSPASQTSGPSLPIVPQAPDGAFAQPAPAQN